MMMRSFSLSLRAFAAVGSLAIFAAAAGADVIYVDAAAAGANNGTSWGDAYSGAQGLATAITAAVSGDEIWVAAGRYIPGAVRTSTFTLKNGVTIYGGFDGDEDELSERDFTANITILSGDVNNNDAAYPSATGWAENCYHVVTGTGRNATAILDGVRITHGFANGGGTDQERGGGIICLSGNAVFRNCHVINNRVTFGGGALYLRTASPALTDCTFESNNGGSFGGACDMFTSCSPVWERCLIINNIANRAGGVEVFGSCQPDFINCIFTGNQSNASGGGGGLFVASSSTVDVINCTIFANSSTVATGGGILTSSSNTRVRNSVVYLNTGPGGATSGHQLSGSTYTTTYSCVQHGFTGLGNISTNPNFIDPPARNFRPVPGSPVIDAARSSDYASPNLLDFASDPRMVDDPNTTDTGAGTITYLDMGAHEFQPGKTDCPEILADPVGATICRNADIVLGVNATGEIDGLQWQFNGVDIPGETTAVFAIQDATNADEGDYTVVITTVGCKTLETVPATIIVCQTDADCNGTINSTDVSEFINQWFTDQAEGTFLADFDENGTVNSTDVSNFINAWFEESASGCAG